jgi:hypothetical protein
MCRGKTRFRPASRVWHLSLILCVLCALCGKRLQAHDPGTSESRIDVDGSEVRAVIYLNVAEFPDLDADRNGRVEVDELDRAIAAIFATVKEHYAIASGGTAPAKRVLTRYQLADDHTVRLQIDDTFASEVRQIEVTSTFDRLTRPDHQHLVNVYAAGIQETAVLGRGREQATFVTRRSLWTNRTVLLVAAAILLLGGRAGVALMQRRRRG